MNILIKVRPSGRITIVTDNETAQFTDLNTALAVLRLEIDTYMIKERDNG